MARSFFITRALADSEDPTALEFFPPKGSDELHEALKEAFPFEGTLSARMRAAVIEFLLQEQQAEQFTPSSTEYLSSPQSTFVSTMPSPSLTTSRTSQEASPSRRESTVSGLPPQEALMDVWSLPNKPQAKVHTRRTMTSDEKKAYKQKRLIGACADCKRRRRKCDHNSAGGSSIVPQKVGKHKKRVTAATPTCKPDAMADFSFDAPGAFNFDEPMVLPMDSSLSFDLGLGLEDFGSFSPDLSDDWQLFPDLPMADLPTVHNDYAALWSSDQQTDVYTQFGPQANMSQSRVSPGSSVQYMLSQSMHSQARLSSRDPVAGAYGTTAWGTSGIGNLPISPVTTETSQSSISRTRSSTNGQDNQANHFAMGASIDQSRVSRNKPIQVPLPTDESRSPTSFNQTVDDIAAPGPQPFYYARSNSTSRSSSPLHPRRLRTSDLSMSQAVDTDIGQVYDRGRLKCLVCPAQHSPALSRAVQTSSEHSHAEASLMIQGLLQGRPLQTSPQAMRANVGVLTLDTIAARQFSSKPSTDASSASALTMSTSRSTLSRNPLPGGLAVEVVTRDRTPRLPAENHHTTEAALLQVHADCRHEGSFVRAPLCVAFYAAYCALAQSSSGLAVLAMLVLGVCVLLSGIITHGAKEWSISTLSNALFSCVKHFSASSSEQGLDFPHTAEAGRQWSSRSCPTRTRSLTSHLRLLRASAMV